MKFHVVTQVWELKPKISKKLKIMILLKKKWKPKLKQNWIIAKKNRKVIKVKMKKMKILLRNAIRKLKIKNNRN